MGNMLADGLVIFLNVLNEIMRHEVYKNGENN